jgi:hypothetical protein
VVARIEMAINKSVSGEKVLSLPWRFESLRSPFSTSCWTTRVLGSVVQISALPMLNLGKELPARHTAASQFVGHDYARYILKAFQQPSKEKRLAELASRRG